MANMNERYNMDVVLNDSRFQSGIRNIIRGLQQADQGTRNTSRGAEQMGVSFGSALKTMAGLGAVNTVFGGIQKSIGFAVQAGMDYTKQMSKVEAISGSSSLQMAQLGSNARKLGAETRWSATNVAEAYEYMALAGWDSNQMIEASLPLLNLATAGALDLAKASDIVTDTMTPFGLAADQAGRVADVFATAQATANLNVEQLGETMKYAAPIAATFGASLEDTTVVAQIFANSGIKASMAGTALRAGLSRLAAPPKAAADALSELNVTVKDNENNMLPLRDIIGQMAPAFNKLGSQAQVAAAKAIFGEEAYAGWVQVLKGGVPEFDRLHGLLDTSAGSADVMAKTMANNLSGAMDNTASAAENLGLILFSRLERGLVAVTNGTGGLIDSMSKALDPYGKSVEAAKLLQTEEQKLVQTEALLEDKKKKGIISQEEYNRGMSDAKNRFQENTTLGKNLADQLKDVEMRHQSGKTTQAEYVAEQTNAINNMKAQATTSQELGTSLSQLYQQYTNGNITAQEFSQRLSDQNLYMKQSAIDGGAFQDKIAMINEQFTAGKMPQDQYNLAIQQAIQGFTDGNVAGETFKNSMNLLDQELVKGNITQDEYNLKKQEAITALQENGTQSGILSQMIADLDMQLADGKITQEQYNQKKKEAKADAESLSLALESERKNQEKVNKVMGVFKEVVDAVWKYIKPIWDDMRKFIGECMKEINKFVQENSKEIEATWKLVMTVIKFFTDTIWRGIKSIIKGAMDVIMGIIKVIGGIMEGDWSKVWEGFKQILRGAVRIILGIFDVSFVKGILNALRNFGASLISNGARIFQNFVRGIGENLANGLRHAITFCTNFITNIKNGLTSLPSTMKEAFTKAWNSIIDMDWKKLGKSIVNGIINGIKGMGSAIGSAASWIFDKLNPFSAPTPPSGVSGGGGSPSNGRSLAMPRMNARMPMSLAGDGLQAFAGGAQQLNTYTKTGFAQGQTLMSALNDVMSKSLSSSVNTNSTPSGSKHPRESRDIVINVPLEVDGRQFAMATARVNTEEVSKYESTKRSGKGGTYQW
ncbi:tail tape measeure protein [Bacillus phage PSYJ-YH]|nr:tail tape measeure protein [Bacillus phage PSYJ-YH]